MDFCSRVPWRFCRAPWSRRLPGRFPDSATGRTPRASRRNGEGGRITRRGWCGLRECFHNSCLPVSPEMDDIHLVQGRDTCKHHNNEDNKDDPGCLLARLVAKFLWGNPSVGHIVGIGGRRRILISQIDSRHDHRLLRRKIVVNSFHTQFPPTARGAAPARAPTLQLVSGTSLRAAHFCSFWLSPEVILPLKTSCIM